MTRLHGAPVSTPPTFSDPFNVLEEMANREGWSYHFSTSSTAPDGMRMVVTLLGLHGDLNFFYEWDEEIQTLNVYCRIGPRVPWARKKEVRALLDRTEKVRTAMKRRGWFDLTADDFVWFWEYLSLSDEYPTWELAIAASLSGALEHCNALTPLFLRTAWGDSSFGKKIIRLALKEVQGTA